MQVKFFNRTLFMALAVATLTACGGGGSSGGSTPSPGGSSEMTLAEIRTTLATSQWAEGYVYGYDTTKLYVDAVPANNFTGFNPDWTKTYRWNVSRDGLIPVWGVSTSPQVGQALDRIEQIVGMTLFERNSLANVAEADVKRGILFKQGVPVYNGDQTNNCASTTTGWVDQSMSYNPPMPQEWTTVESDPSSIPLVTNRSKIYIALNLANTACADRWGDIVTHEIGHALGLRQHFEGFGVGVSVDPARFNPVLRALYNNPVGVPINSVN